MLNVIALLASSVASLSTWADGTSLLSAPSYSSASIVNSASNSPGALAPNTLATIYGSGLSFVTAAVTISDVGARLPTALPGAGVRVLTCGIPSPLYYVSPTQVNFLVPAVLSPGNCDVQVVTDGRAGPEVRVPILDATPALFSRDGGWAIATLPDGSVIGSDKPAHPGDIVVLWGTGFGQTNPMMSDGLIPRSAASISRIADSMVRFDGKPVESGVLYIGVTPGFGGLYQINLVLPEGTGDDPEVVVSVAGQSSPGGVRLPVRRLGNNQAQPAGFSVR